MNYIVNYNDFESEKVWNDRWTSFLTLEEAIRYKRKLESTHRYSSITISVVLPNLD